MAGKTKTGHRWTKPTVFQRAKGTRQHASVSSAVKRSAYGQYRNVPAMNSLTVESRHRLRYGRPPVLEPASALFTEPPLAS